MSLEERADATHANNDSFMPVIDRVGKQSKTAKSSVQRNGHGVCMNCLKGLWMHGQSPTEQRLPQDRALSEAPRQDLFVQTHSCENMR